MSKFEKAKERIRAKPKDYTYTEAKALLSQLRFAEYNKRKNVWFKSEILPGRRSEGYITA